MLLFLVTLLTGLTSGSILAIAGSFAVFLVIVKPSFKNLSLMGIKIASVAVFVFFLALSSGKQEMLLGPLRSELAQIFSLGDSQKMTSGRSLIWKDSVRIFRDNPLGTGWGQFEETFQKYPDMSWFTIYDGPPSAPHNEFISVLVEGGLVSLGAYFLFWTGLLSVLFSMERRDGTEFEKVALLSSLLTGVFLFSLVGGIFDERKLLAIYFWTVFGAVLSQAWRSPENTPEAIHEN
jgi:O-antigen ligase